MRFVDSHLHLGGPDALQALALASSNDTLLLTCGIDQESSWEGVNLAILTRTARAFVGVHPSEVLKEPALDWLPGALERASGVGEIGLDPKYSPVGPGSTQVRAFREQLEAAEHAAKPIQVHSRNAEEDCMEALSSFGLKSVLFHWFQDEGRLRRVQDRGYFVSFGPSLVYSKKLQRMAADSARELVLTETDSPVAYVPLGGVSGPSLVPSVVFRLAELWEMTFEEARELVRQNAVRYLGSSEKG